MTSRKKHPDKGFIKPFRRVASTSWENGFEPESPSALLLVVLLLILLTNHTTDGVHVSRLPDGTSYRLVMTAFTNNFTYKRSSAPRELLPFLPIIPDFIEKRLFSSGGSLGLGGSTNPDLMLVIEATNDSGPATQPDALRIRDDLGNAFDMPYINGVLSIAPGNVSMMYVAHVTPNRSSRLFIEPLVELPGGIWTNLGPFAVTNPKYGDHPQLTPEPVPQTREDGELSVTLRGFESTAGQHDGETPLAMPRRASLEFDFTDSGLPSENHRLHRIVLVDATGNQWSPHLSTNTASRLGWIIGGKTEFRGGLWPGEDAWKIDLQVIRTAGFNAADIWDVPVIRLPKPNEFVKPNTTFELDDLNATIANMLAPGVQITNRWQWSVRYWGNESSVYPIGMECLNMGDRRPVVLEACNENGTDFRIINHQNVDHPMQCIFVSLPRKARPSCIYDSHSQS